MHNLMNVVLFIRNEFGTSEEEAQDDTTIIFHLSSLLHAFLDIT